MRYSIVFTCSRCGTRAESEIRTPQGARCVYQAIVTGLALPAGDGGCPICRPELAEDPAIDAERWRAMVERARVHRPS